MLRCFDNDDAFRDYSFDCYGYPTKMLRLPFSAPPPGLRSIADGLTTFLDERHGNRSKIFLVSHSLGGLISRQMIVSELRAGRTPRIEKLALIAVPNSGSMLANVGSLVSLRHRQLKRLSRDDEALRSLNADWEQLKVEEAIAVRYIVGGCDRVVPHESAVPYVDRERNKSLLIDADHRSIIRPKDVDDIRFRTVRRFLLEREGSASVGNVSAEHENKTATRSPDPLFDAYTPVDSPFYVERQIDRIVMEALGTGHIWLVGASGVGKTAALRRAGYESGWALNHISLGGYVIDTPTKIFNALASELANLCGYADPLGKEADFGACCSYIKTVLRQFSQDDVIATVIEELPVPAEDLGKVVDQAGILVESLSTDPSLNRRAVFAFSSIKSPENVTGKAREKIQLLNIGTWSKADSRKLVDLLANSIRPHLSDEEREKIVECSLGSPRFIKQLFRKWRSMLPDNDNLPVLLAQVRSEQL